MFHTSAYAVNQGAVTKGDMSAATDDVLVIRNSHIILTEDYNLLAAWGFGLTLTRMQFTNAGLIQKSANNLYPLFNSNVIQNLAYPMDFREAPLDLPLNEEIKIAATTTGVGPQDAVGILHLGTNNWNRNYPPFLDRLMTRATVTITAGAARQWTALAAITMEQDLLNGVYAVVGCQVVTANAQAFRIRFVDQPIYLGKQPRPGGLCAGSTGIQPWPAQYGGMGEMGRFTTFSLPTFQTFNDVTGGTYDIMMSLLYLGPDQNMVHYGM